MLFRRRSLMFGICANIGFPDHWRFRRHSPRYATVRPSSGGYNGGGRCKLEPAKLHSVRVLRQS